MAFWNKTKEELKVIPSPAELVIEPETENKKKRRGQPQDRTKLTRNKVVQIRMTEDEVGKLKSAAAAANMTLADFVIAGVDQDRQIVLPGGLEIRKELFHEGKNLNQAVYLAHVARKEGRPVDLQIIMDAVTKVENNLDRLAELIENWHINLSKD